MDPETQRNGLANQLEADSAMTRVRNLQEGALWLLAGCGAAALAQFNDGELPALALSHSQAITDSLNSADSLLIGLGAIGLTTATVGRGALRIASNKDPRFHAIDLLSDRELTFSVGRTPAFLRKVAAGRWPVMASAVVGLTALFGAIGNEIQDGPNRPIDAVVRMFPGGEDASIIVQHADAMPMLDSDLSRDFTLRVVQEAEVNSISTTPFVVSLGHISSDDEVDKGESTLAYGLPVDPTSPVYWDGNMGCEDIPIIIDTASGYEVGQKGLALQGSTVEIVGEATDMSAINRVGIIADIKAVQTCFEKSPNVSGIVLDSSKQDTQSIAELANAGINESMTAITVDDMRRNSEEFWQNNVKPLTNIFALVAGVVNYIAISINISDRLHRNRRELVTKLEEGVSPSVIGSMEMARNMKELPLATVLGTVASWAVSPFISLAVLGTQSSVGVREVLAGAGVVFGSSVIALAGKVGTQKRIFKSLGLRSTNAKGGM